MGKVTDDMMTKRNVSKVDFVFICHHFACLDCFARFPQQKSNEIFLSKCHLYRMEMLMKQAAGSDSASVGIRLPNGSYERPIGNNRLFWVLPGKCSIKS